MLLLYTFFVFPFCLCPSFPSNFTKHSFSLTFQLGFVMMSSRPTLCGHSKSALLTAPSKASGAAEFPLVPPRGNLHFSSFICPNPCLSLGNEMLASDCSWDRLMSFKVPWRKESQAYSGIIPCIHPVECGGCLSLVNSGEGPAPAFFSWWLCIFGQNVFCLQRGREESVS